MFAEGTSLPLSDGFDEGRREGGGHLHMTSALRGREVSPKADYSTDRLHDYDCDRGRGSTIPNILQASYVNGPEEEYY